jgi:predicted metallo-beta-lactamase superfamily hydrolase
MREFDILAEAIKNVTGVTRDELVSKKRNRPFVDARILAATVLKEKAQNATVGTIGEMLSIDHSTVSYYWKQHFVLMKNELYKEKYRKLITILNEKLILTDVEVEKGLLLKRKKKLEEEIKRIDAKIKILDSKRVEV